MKSALFSLLFFISLTAFPQESNAGYNADLADSLGADDYGMKSYYFVLLKTGEANIVDKDSLSKLFKGHFDNISRMADSGNLIVSGPFMQNERSYRGLFIIEAENEDSLQVMLNKDPTIALGVFEAEVTPWYGSAALPTYYENHRKIEKLKP